MAKYIILGAGGAIGNVITDELLAQNVKVKLVSRHTHEIPGTESQQADLTNPRDVNQAVEESSIVYLVAGLQYKVSVWREQWPKIMRNAIDACKTKNAELIFFDTVYSYGKVDGPMTEETPYNPISKKGEIRALLANQLVSEANAGNLKAIIARAADFYGPYTEKTSVPFILAIKNLARDKKARWLVNAETKHSFTYTGDCGKALYLLATNEDAFNQVWHLPTASPPITGKEFIEIAAKNLGIEPDYSVYSKLMLRLGGLFDSNIRELYEVLYQNEYDYIFDSSKFESRFGFKPTSYQTGIKETIEHFRQRKII
jgi:nucleoside-diphosphate-sugar epimerase